MKRICVFCGSNPGTSPIYTQAAAEFGALIAERGLGVVYGGSNVGVMGALADAAMAAGGDVIGVIPDALVRKEVAHGSITELRVVGSMHERKAVMADLADGFVALPGGLGTLDEFFEICTWAQLGIHHHPCALLDVGGFFQPLLHFLDQVVARGFLPEAHRRMILVESDPVRLLDACAAYRPPAGPKWMDDRGR